MGYILPILVGAVIAGFAYLYGYARYRIGRPKYCTSKTSMMGKTVIITGGNSGIGKETTIDLAKRGARVILACRNPDKANAAVREIKKICGHEQVVYRHLDLADFDSVKTFAEQIIESEERLDVLINNGGLYTAAIQNVDGLDTTFKTNHLGHFLLTYLLLDKLKMSTPSRIINVSSVMHMGKGLNFTKENNQYIHLKGYAASKLANVLHCLELTKRLNGTAVTANSLNPGGVMTSIWYCLDHMFPLWIAKLFRVYLRCILWDCRAGAQTSIYCAVDETLEQVSGKYFYNCHLEQESIHARDEVMAAQLWDVSLDLCGLTR